MWVNQKVDLFKRDEDGNWTSSATSLPNAREINTSIGIGKKKDRCGFKVNNLNENKYFNNTSSIQTEDQLKIYFWQGTGSEQTSDLVLNGVTRAPSYTHETGDYSFTGENFVESLFKIQIFLDSAGDAWRTDRVIREIIKQVNATLEQSQSPGKPRYIYGGEETEDGGATDEWSSTCGNPVAKNDSSAFSSHTVFEKYNSAFQLLEKYSGSEYTDDGSYLFWIDYDVDNDRFLFRWRYKSNTRQGTIEETDGWNLKTSKNPDDVVNWLIMNCGLDVEGHAIEILVNNMDSAKSFGPEMRYYTRTSNLAPDLWNAEFEKNRTSFNVDDEGNPTTDKFPISYNYTMNFKEIDGNGDELDNDWVVTKDSEFNKAIRERAKYEARLIGQEILLLWQDALWKVEITVFPNASYSQGEVYLLNLPSNNLPNRPLRLMQVDQDVWEKNLFFEQDESLLLEGSE